MKKIFTFIIIIVALSAINQKAEAQIKIGAGLSYATWLNTPGVNLRAEAEVFENLSIVPMLDIYLPRISTWTLINTFSLHVHYNIEVLDQISVYPLLGATMKSYLDFDRSGYDRVYHRFALNPSGGAGALYELSKDFSVFTESRLELGYYSQFVLTAGVRFIPGS